MKHPVLAFLIDLTRAHRKHGGYATVTLSITDLSHAIIIELFFRDHFRWA